MDIRKFKIGDFAHIVCDSVYGGHVDKVFQVSAVMLNSFAHFESIWSSEGNMGKDHIEPIDLTPDILERLGWVKELSGRCFYDGNNMTIRYSEEENKFYTDIFNRQVTIKYVHELQHLLDICGLDITNELKEIL